MEKTEKQIYGFCFLLGGVFLLIYAGVSLIDLISKTIYYFLFIFAIIVMLYGVTLILIGTLIMFANVRGKKSFATIISSIGIVIITLSITAIIIDSITIVNIFEIVSGIGLIFLGIKLFFRKIKLKDEYSIKITHTSQERKSKAILRGIIILSIFLCILSIFLFTKIVLLFN